MQKELFKLILHLYFHRSKSTNDIQVDPKLLLQARHEELQKYREQIKESEDKWQDVSLTVHTYRRLTPKDICLPPTILVIRIETS